MRASITVKLSVLVVIFVTTASFLLGRIYVKGSEEILVKKAISDLEQEAAIFQYPLTGMIAQLKDDVRLLRHVPPPDGIIRACNNVRHDPHDNSTEKQWLSRLSTIFEEMIFTRQHYVQIRLIEVKNNGQELLRVDRVGQEIQRIPPERLQQKGSKAYFKQTIPLKEDQVYLSNIELNRDFGVITEPYTLVLRAATPVYRPDNTIFGIVIINANFSTMLHDIKQHVAKNRELYIATTDGSYIMHPDSRTLYGSGLKHSTFLQHDYPEFLRISSQTEKQNITILPQDKRHGDIVSYHRYNYDSLDKEKYLSIVLKAPYMGVIKSVISIQEKGVYLSVLITVITAILAILMLRFLIKPLNCIADAVIQYREGESAINLPTEYNDEIGVLAKEFQAMIKQKKEEDWIKESLVTTSKKLLEFQDFETFSNGLIRHIVQTADAQYGVIYLSDDHLPHEQTSDKTVLHLMGLYGASHSDNSIPTSIPLGHGLVGQIAEDKTLKVIDHHEQAPTIKTALSEQVAYQTLILPIIYQNSVSGVIELAKTSPFAPEQVVLLEQLGFNIAVMINNLSATVKTVALLEEARHTTQRLKRSNQELDDFAYIASHDLKEPLRGLFNNSKFLLEDYEDKLDEEGIFMLQRMGYLSQRMEALINDLLYFSRLGRQDLAIQSTDLNTVIHDIKEMLHDTLEEKSATVTTHGTLPTIVCDSPRVIELFRNLITNAIKYNDKPEKHVEIGYLSSTTHDNETVENVFYVKDNGIGIKEEFHHDVFRIFKRLNDEDDAHKGTGVGLTFVKKIIERHGGTIWIESMYGKGTTFYFTLPM